MNQEQNTTGYYRINQILEILPVSKSAIWKWVREHSFPQPSKLSPRVTVWRKSDIAEWMKLRDQQ